MLNNHQAWFDKTYNQTEWFQKQVSMVTDTPDVAHSVVHPAEARNVAR